MTAAVPGVLDASRRRTSGGGGGGGPAPVFRSTGASATQSSGAPSIPYPAGLATGDLLVMHYSCVNNVTPTTPSGWTKLFGPISMAGGGNTNVGYVYWKIATGSESGTLTMGNTGGSNYATGRIFAYSGPNTTTPIDVYATANLPTSGTTGTCPSVTTTGANRTLLHMYWDWTGSTTVTQNASDTERYDSFDTALNLATEMADTTQATAGASGTSSATFGTATSGGMCATIALMSP